MSSSDNKRKLSSQAELLPTKKAPPVSDILSVSKMTLQQKKNLKPYLMLGNKYNSESDVYHFVIDANYIPEEGVLAGLYDLSISNNDEIIIIEEDFQHKSVKLVIDILNPSLIYGNNPIGLDWSEYQEVRKISQYFNIDLPKKLLYLHKIYKNIYSSSDQEHSFECFVADPKYKLMSINLYFKEDKSLPSFTGIFKFKKFKMDPDIIGIYLGDFIYIKYNFKKEIFCLVRLRQNNKNSEDESVIFQRKMSSRSRSIDYDSDLIEISYR